jgi:hypothetical protein
MLAREANAALARDETGRADGSVTRDGLPQVVTGSAEIFPKRDGFAVLRGNGGSGVLIGLPVRSDPELQNVKLMEWVGKALPFSEGLSTKTASSRDSPL